MEKAWKTTRKPPLKRKKRKEKDETATPKGNDMKTSIRDETRKGILKYTEQPN